MAQVFVLDEEWARILPLSHLCCVAMDTLLITLSFGFLNFFFKIFFSNVYEGM